MPLKNLKRYEKPSPGQTIGHLLSRHLTEIYVTKWPMVRTMENHEKHEKQWNIMKTNENQ